jgi:hypothetical protein
MSGMRIRDLALTLTLALAATPAQQAPRIGLRPERPESPPTEGPTYGLLLEAPRAWIDGPHRLVVELRSAEPTPPGLIHLGLNTLDEDLDWPRYRASFQETIPDGEDPAPTAFRSAHRFELDFRGLLRTLPNTPFTPRLCWRAELWLPSKRSARFVEGRVHFDPETLGDTVDIRFGPVVDQVTATSAVLSWETDRDADSRVWIGDREIHRAGPTRRHEVELTDLPPDARIEYRVGSGATRSRTYAFRTAASGPFSFAAMVDSREGVGGGMHNMGGVEAFAVRALATHAYRSGAAFILFAGDLINGYTSKVEDFEMQLSAWRRAIEPVHARIPVYEGMGNHEALFDLLRVGRRMVRLDKAGADSAEAVFGRMFVNPQNGPGDEGPGSPPYAGNVYRFDRGNARFFVLNNNYWWCSDPHRVGANLEGFVLPQQLAWLREEVAAADREPGIDHLFFSAQEPPFPNGGHTGDAMWYRGGDTDRDGKVDAADVGIVQNRNALWQIVSGSAKSVAFITGDEHAYSRLWVGPDTPVGPRALPDGGEAVFGHGVWQVTSGGAGAPYYDKELDLPWRGERRAHSPQPHYAMFHVDGAAVRLEVFSQTGQRVDAATLREGRDERR